jgi:hypothetical protein
VVGQAEGILTYSNLNPNPGTTNYVVGYDDLYYLDHPDIWIKIGGSDTNGGTNHGSTYYNRYMRLWKPNLTDGPAYQIYRASIAYLAGHPEIIHPLCMNDMALPFGGKFDICNQKFSVCSAATPWTSPHAAHDRGSAADIAGIGTAQCTNANGTGVNITEFIQRCVDKGALAANSINEGNHAHCAFENPNSWPH